MSWKSLLSPVRNRELFEGAASKRIAGDPRDPFEQDYGRAVFSTPVRRLQDKAQVFPLEQHDAVRTRLTHSYEVSSVAKSLGRAAGKWIVDKENLDVNATGTIETIAATCGLIHDLGNPPFGHAGEDALREWFQKKLKEDKSFFDDFNMGSQRGLETQFAQDFLKFEGNAQTLRLISRLQVLADRYGLNLTAGTMSASCKYVAASNETSKNRAELKKPGHFASENDLFQKITAETGTGSSRHPIAYLVEASDDIVYSTVDLEDAVKKGILRWHVLEQHLRNEIKGSGDILDLVLKDAKDKVGIEAPETNREDEALAQAFRTYAIIQMVTSSLEVFKTRYAEIMRGEYDRELVKDEVGKASALVQACKRVGQKHIYPAGDNLSLEVMGRRIIQDLMTIFWEGAEVGGPDPDTRKFSGKIYCLASENYRLVMKEELKAKQLPERYVRLQLVTDHISGMTDTYAATLHKKLTNA